MKKILFIHHGLGLGGAEKLRWFLLRNITRNRYDITVCCIGEKGFLGGEIEKIGYRVDELKKDPNSLNIRVTYALIKYLKKEKPNILHTSLFNSNFHGRIASLFCGIPHVITEEHGEHRQYRGIKFIPYILADLFLSRLTDFIVCCSEKIKDDIIEKEKLSRTKVIAIENCLDTEIYITGLKREDVRGKYNIAKEEIIFIAVANLKSGKGHDYLIEALQQVQDSGYSFKCFLAGDGPLRETLLRKCRALGLSDRIFFLGNVENITDYLNASDIFILPSFSEGLSIALMEAMFMGLASIVTNVGSNPDLVKTDVNGIVVAPGDINALKNAIIFYLQNKDSIKEFGARSKSIIEVRYSSIGKYRDRYFELWDRCLEARK